MIEISGADNATDVVDVAIIGAGPAGLYGAYYAGFRGFSTIVIDALPEVGGQVSAMYPEKEIFDIAGFPSVKGRELIDGLYKQASAFSPTYWNSENVATLTQNSENHWTLTTESGRSVTAKAVVITGGIGAFAPRPLPVGMEWLGKGLVHFVPHLADHAGKHIVIAGGGDSAFDWAYSLQPIAASVTLVHRRDTFRAHAATVDAVKAMGVRLITSAEITQVNGAEGITEVVVTHKESQETEVLPAETLVAALGFIANIGPINNWGLELEKRHIRVDTSMQTSLPGVFAAGDITTYPGKVPLISVGFGEAATAINNAAPFIDEHFGVFPGHSTGSSSD
jgi:thioredoxin reductase (NADPH)